MQKKTSIPAYLTKGLGLLSFTFVLIVIAVLGFIQTPLFKQWLIHRIEQGFSSSYPSKIRIGTIEGWIPGNVKAHQLSLIIESDPLISAPDTVLQVEDVHFRLNIFQLLHGRYFIPDIEFQNAKLSVRAINDSLTNLEYALQSKHHNGVESDYYLSNGLHLFVNHLIVENLQVYVEPSLVAQRTEFNIPSGDFKMDGNLSVNLDGETRSLDIRQFMVGSASNDLAFSVSGSLFSDTTRTSVKNLRVEYNDSYALVDVSLNKLNLNQKTWRTHVDSLQYELNVYSSSIQPDHITQLNWVKTRLPWLSMPGIPIAVEAKLKGDHQQSTLESFEVTQGRSVLRLTSRINQLWDNSNRSYSLNVTEFSLDTTYIRQLPWFQTAQQGWIPVLSDQTLRGKIEGNMRRINADMELNSQAGILEWYADYDISRNYFNKVQIQTKNWDLKPYTVATLKPTRLSMNGQLEGYIRGQDVQFFGTLGLYQSTINGYPIDSIRVIASYKNREISPNLQLKSPMGNLELSGSLRPFDATPRVVVTGQLSKLDLSAFSSDSLYPVTNLNARFNTDFYGRSLEDIYGKISIDTYPSTYKDLAIKPMQAYADFNQPGSPTRIFRFTSSVGDAFISGNFDTQNVINQARYWTDEIQKQIKKSVLRDPEVTDSPVIISSAIQPLALNFAINIKDITLIQRIVPEFSQIYTRASLEGTVRSDQQRLLLDATILDDSTRFEALSTSKLDLRLTMGLQHGRDFGSSANIQLKSEIETLSYNRVQLRDVRTTGTVLNDTIKVDQTITRIGDTAFSSISLYAAIGDENVNLFIPEFFLGNDEYSWKAKDLPHIVIESADQIRFKSFELVNANQKISVSGIMGKRLDERLQISLFQVDLRRISELIGSRVKVDGILNGTWNSTSLLSLSDLEGNITVDELAINNRIVGDIRINSEYNAELKRFDTTARVKTDSIKYATYLNRNKSIGQDILLTGYLSPKNLNPKAESLFSFDVDFNEVDLWVLRYLLQDVFTEIEGRAVGKGTIKGDLESFTFDSKFTVDQSTVVPVFLNTRYSLNGNIRFTSREGVVFDNVRVNDSSRGTGILSGDVDMNDFKFEKFLNLRLRMNRLEFLNNTYAQDIPFYGKVSGTGEIRLIGTTVKPFVQTVRPITVTPNSKMTIPMLEETYISQQTNFVRFVEQFFDTKSISKTGPGQAPPPVQTRSFMDIFQMDLQFNMPQDAAIEFIFDRVTNEYIYTRGTGTARMTLEAGNLGMFGTFDIDRGQYNFVGGDIFSKKFKIRPGGVVIWDGVAQDPRIEVSAYYSSRPNLQPLGTGRNVRVPIDLILNLTGRMASIENDFYFEYPTNFDPGLTASELNILNSEDQKLLQATSLLVTGNFLPVNTGTQANINLQNQVTQASLGQLLSGQINYLLNSSLSNFDFDLNVTGFDQADLGIGLRLFDDRLELRRDGTIVGDQSSIGDLAATYRINRFMAVEIFHRQDVTSSRGFTQEGTIDRVNGIGVQYQVQFGSWRKLFDDLLRVLKGIKG